MPRETTSDSKTFIPEESALYQASLADQGSGNSVSASDEVNGLNDNERILSVMNIEMLAGDLPLDRQLALLKSSRKFAEVIAGRHYIHGWSDGKNQPTGEINIHEAAFLMDSVAKRLDAIADDLDRSGTGGNTGAKVFSITADLHNSVKEIQTMDPELRAAYRAKRKGG